MKHFGSRREANRAFKQASAQWHFASLKFDSGLDDCIRRVQAVSRFDPRANPSNPVAWGLPVNTLGSGRQTVKLTAEQTRTQAVVKDRMELHRALVCGTGFYSWMTKAGPTDIASALNVATHHGSTKNIRALPTINFLDLGNDRYSNAIVDEARPVPWLHEQSPARPWSHCSCKSIITTKTEFGKTKLT